MRLEKCALKWVNKNIVVDFSIDTYFSRAQNCPSDVEMKPQIFTILR